MNSHKPIPNFEGYSINKKGEVVSFKYGYAKILKCRTLRDGYIYYMLRQNGKYKNIAMHRLLALAFIKNEDKKAEVNHIDGDKQNNNLSNLEWVTRSENIRHAFDTGLNKSIGKGHYNAKIVLNLQTGIYYETITDAEILNGIKAGCLGDKLRGRNPNNTNFILA